MKKPAESMNATTSYAAVAMALDYVRPKIKCAYNAEILLTVGQEERIISYAHGSTYVLAFSVTEGLISDRGYHSTEKLKATINLVNETIRDNHEPHEQVRIIILVADELQAINAQANSDRPLAELQQECREFGNKWVADNIDTFNLLCVKPEIQHWADWTSGI
ncbi:MAG: hypothetical protein M3R00_07070, partial [Pseudomonadota bacterium]|nr:hypothetical protein [Pseudomonadota bacterium]